MRKVIQAPKRIGANNAYDFEAEVKQAFENGVSDLLFEMQDTIYISSAGLRVFLMAQKKINAVQGKMALQHVGPQVMEVLEVTGFSGVLTLYTGEEADG